MPMFDNMQELSEIAMHVSKVYRKTVEYPPQTGRPPATSLRDDGHILCLPQP